MYKSTGFAPGGRRGATGRLRADRRAHRSWKRRGMSGDPGPESTKGSRRPASVLPAGIFLLAAVLLGLVPACRTQSNPTGPEGDVDLRLDVVPLILKADSASTATVWATLLVRGEPAPDSTVVNFVVSQGAIDPVGYTVDGLASATYTSGGEPGSAAIVAQAMTVRDTVVVTLY